MRLNTVMVAGPTIITKRCVLLAVLLVTGLTQIWAREISGSVVSEVDSLPMPGVVCELRDGNKVLAKVASGADGQFRIDTGHKYAASVVFSMTNFANTIVVVPDGSKDIMVGTVYMSDSRELPEVVVTAATMVDSRGRTIVYPSGEYVKASSSSISLFQKLPLPGLEANPITRTLTVEGGGPMILIDGVPASIDEVRALQPKDILKVEYSRITPARYAGKDCKGFISITRKQRNDGGSFFGYMRACPTTGFLDADIRASYHQGPSEFTLSYSPSWRNYQKVYDNVIESYIAPDFRVDIESHDRNPFNYLGNPLSLKYYFRPKPTTAFVATFNANMSSSSRRVIGYNTDTELGSYDINSKQSSKAFSPWLDLFFSHDFNDRNSLEVQMVGTISSDDYRRSNSYDYPDREDETYVMDVDSRRYSLITELSYIHSFSDRTSLSGGYQSTLSRSRNKYLTSDYDPVLTENHNYLYVRVSQRIGKVYLEGSTGMKLFWNKNGDVRRHFSRNNTSFWANWSINQRWSLAGRFNYASSIPGLTAITDYMQQVNPYLFTNGNPDLKAPQFFNYSVSASANYPKFSTTLIVGYSETIDPSISDLTYMGNGKFLSRTINYDSDKKFSTALYLTVGPFAGFGANVSFGLDHFYTHGPGWKHNKTFCSGSASLWWNKGPFTVSYWRKFPAKYLSGQYVGKDENGDALQFEYKPDKHWTFGVSWMYMFNVKGTEYPGWNYSPINPSYKERYIKNNGNMVVLSVSYSADFGSIFRRGNRSLNNKDNGSSLLKM